MQAEAARDSDPQIRALNRIRKRGGSGPQQPHYERYSLYEQSVYFYNLATPNDQEENRLLAVHDDNILVDELRKLYNEEEFGENNRILIYNVLSKRFPIHFKLPIEDDLLSDDKYAKRYEHLVLSTGLAEKGEKFPTTIEALRKCKLEEQNPDATTAAIAVSEETEFSADAAANDNDEASLDLQAIHHYHTRLQLKVDSLVNEAQEKCRNLSLKNRLWLIELSIIERERLEKENPKLLQEINSNSKRDQENAIAINRNVIYYRRLARTLQPSVEFMLEPQAIDDFKASASSIQGSLQNTLLNLENLTPTGEENTLQSALNGYLSTSSNINSDNDTDEDRQANETTSLLASSPDTNLTSKQQKARAYLNNEECLVTACLDDAHLDYNTCIVSRLFEARNNLLTLKTSLSNKRFDDINNIRNKRNILETAVNNELATIEKKLATRENTLLSKLSSKTLDLDQELTLCLCKSHDELGELYEEFDDLSQYLEDKRLHQRCNDKERNRLLEIVEDCKSTIINAIIEKMVRDLDLVSEHKEKAKEKTTLQHIGDWFRHIGMWVGYFDILALGSERGMNSCGALVSAAVPHSQLARILAAAIGAIPFCLMYFAFEASKFWQYTHENQISKSILHQRVMQYRLLTGSAFRNLDIAKKQIDDKIQNGGNSHQNHANKHRADHAYLESKGKTLQSYNKLLGRIATRTQRHVDTANDYMHKKTKYEKTRAYKVKHGFAAGFCATLSGIFGGFLGIGIMGLFSSKLTIAVVIAGLAVGNVYSLIALGIALAAAVAYVLVSVIVKQHGKNLLDSFDPNTPLKLIADEDRKKSLNDFINDANGRLKSLENEIDQCEKKIEQDKRTSLDSVFKKIHAEIDSVKKTINAANDEVRHFFKIEHKEINKDNFTKAKAANDQIKKAEQQLEKLEARLTRLESLVKDRQMILRSSGTRFAFFPRQKCNRSPSSESLHAENQRRLLAS